MPKQALHSDACEWWLERDLNPRPRDYDLPSTSSNQTVSPKPSLNFGRNTPQSLTDCSTSFTRRCRVCGCTDDDCSRCIQTTGQPCHWIDHDLCSACSNFSHLSTGMPATTRRKAAATYWLAAPLASYQVRVHGQLRHDFIPIRDASGRAGIFFFGLTDQERTAVEIIATESPQAADGLIGRTNLEGETIMNQPTTELQTGAGAPAPAYRIVVLQRGWVAVGHLSKDPQGDGLVLENAQIVRRWGTTQGLGQLAESGPTSNTVLDKGGTLRFHPNAIILTYDTDESKWK